MEANETVRRAPDGGVIHELPEKAYDYLIELWARSHNTEIVSVQKFKEGEHEQLEQTGTDGE